MKKHILFLLAGALAFAACKSSTETTPALPLGDSGNDVELIGNKLYVTLTGSDKIAVGPVSGSGDRVFILDQGEFGKNNARLDDFSWGSSSLSSAVFGSATDHKSIVFPQGSGPWKIVQISTTEALVADYKSKNMAVIDLLADTIKSTIALDSGQTSITLLNGNAYVTTLSQKIFIIDEASKTVVGHGSCDANPETIVADPTHGYLFVATAGDYAAQPGRLTLYDAATMSFLGVIDMGTGASINQIFIGGTEAYVLLNDRVGTYDFTTNILTTDTLFTKGYYGGYYDAPTKRLYLADAKDFQNNGVVDVFDMNSRKLLKSIPVGVVPAFFTVVR